MTKEPKPAFFVDLEKIRVDPWELMGPRNAAKRPELFPNGTDRESIEEIAATYGATLDALKRKLQG